MSKYKEMKNEKEVDAVQLRLSQVSVANSTLVFPRRIRIGQFNLVGREVAGSKPLMWA